MGGLAVSYMQIKKHEKDIIDDNIPGRYRGICPGADTKGT
jgi:hypothetical protein